MFLSYLVSNKEFCFSKVSLIVGNSLFRYFMIVSSPSKAFIANHLFDKFEVESLICSSISKIKLSNSS
jgi:hypothetical protein